MTPSPSRHPLAAVQALVRPIVSPGPIRNLVLLWLAWGLIVIGFQAMATARLQPQRPDNVLPWTAKETTATAQNDKPYLLNPFMNNQVAWDSEFYLAIASGGYDDPNIRTIPNGPKISIAYAFMPFYPLVTRIVAIPLRVLGLDTIATTTLAAVLVSLLGTLAAMLALYDIAREELGEDGGMRAAFYLIAFPAGFFLAMVYTEGLFVGIAFGSLAMIKRRHFVWGALLAVLATWTRAVGVALAIPLVVYWLQSLDWIELDREWKQWVTQKFPGRALGQAAIGLAPVLAYAAWRASWLGAAFSTVEDLFFGRGFLQLGSAFTGWILGFQAIFGPVDVTQLFGQAYVSNAQTAVFYIIEFGAIAIGFAACLACWRRYPAISWYSLAAIVIALTSGGGFPQGMVRYVLAAPVVFLFLARLGKNPAFDRAWTMLSILIMGLEATLYAFNLWVA